MRTARAADGGVGDGTSTAEGNNALAKLGTGTFNTGLGYFALYNNSDGSSNTATGANALTSNTAGIANTATGVQALYTNASGNSNTADGFDALLNNTGSNNTAVGYFAGVNLNIGDNNIALGSNAGLNLTSGNNNIDIGNKGKAGESNKIRIGTNNVQNGTFIAGIYNVNEAGTIKPVYINSNGQLGTQAPASSRRFKEAIKPMDKTSEAILGLKPVTFQYKSDEQATPQFGLIAEEVAKVNPNLVVRDDDGAIYTVRYEAVNAMLLNEFLKEHRKIQDQAIEIAQMKKQIKALTTSLGKVSERIHLDHSLSQVLVSNEAK